MALGCAVASLEFGKERSRIAKNIEISDVVSSSLGVLTADGTVSKILERNTKIPIIRTRNYTNSNDYADEVIIPIFQGEGEYPDENDHLGEFWISIEPMPVNQNMIDVSFEVGKEFGILHVTAIDQMSGNERTVKMEARSTLSKKEKNKWMKKLLGVESIEVNIKNISTRDALTLYLNPVQTIKDLKNELMEKGIMSRKDMLFFDDIELEDAKTISGTEIINMGTIEIRQKDE